MKKAIKYLNGILIIAVLFTACKTQAPVQAELNPPLTDEELSKPVPDFLDEDQQFLFREAKSVYQRLFNGSTGIAYGDIYGYGNEFDHYQIDNHTYISNTAGRYRNFIDFEIMIQSLFVNDFWNARNITSSNNEIYPLYTNCDGKLCYIDFEGRGGFAYNNNFDDEFELVSKTESEISFYAIGHFSWRYQIGDETIEQRDIRLKEGYEYSKKFLITMVLTDDGWRFSKFEDPLTDGGDYEGAYFNK